MPSCGADLLRVYRLSQYIPVLRLPLTGCMVWGMIGRHHCEKTRKELPPSSRARHTIQFLVIIKGNAALGAARRCAASQPLQAFIRVRCSCCVRSGRTLGPRGLQWTCDPERECLAGEIG
eukprot:353796-Chlamydomonas_euryale.AAC.7